MTKRVTIEKSKLFFVIPKIISVIPYPCNYLVSYHLSLKLFCQLSLIPKTPNRASKIPRRAAFFFQHSSWYIVFENVIKHGLSRTGSKCRKTKSYDPVSLSIFSDYVAQYFDLF